MLMLMQIPAT